jgi:hypothetical protein
MINLNSGTFFVPGAANSFGLVVNDTANVSNETAYLFGVMNNTHTHIFPHHHTAG